MSTVRREWKFPLANPLKWREQQCTANSLFGSHSFQQCAIPGLLSIRQWHVCSWCYPLLCWSQWKLACLLVANDHGATLASKLSVTPRFSSYWSFLNTSLSSIPFLSCCLYFHISFSHSSNFWHWAVFTVLLIMFFSAVAHRVMQEPTVIGKESVGKDGRELGISQLFPIRKFS